MTFQLVRRTMHPSWRSAQLCDRLSDALFGMESRLFLDLDTCGTTSILSDKIDPSELETAHSLPDSKLVPSCHAWSRPRRALWCLFRETRRLCFTGRQAERTEKMVTEKIRCIPSVRMWKVG